MKPETLERFFGIQRIQQFTDAPILLHIHGGYWQEETLTHTNNSFPALSLHNYGIKYISVGYELCPNTNLHGIVNNIELAVYKCLEYAKRLKSRGLYLSGHSAGAHLVASLFKNFIPTLSTEDQKLFKSAFLLCGLYDLSPLVESQANQIIGLDEESAEDASPIHYSNFGTETSFHVVVAQHDSPVFRRQGKRLNDHIMSLGLHSRYILVENVDHYEIVEKLTEEEFPLTRHIVNVIIG
ncbi:hypothetical protein NQ318_011950 [Aromia moschata]|uniref:Alpha/beta hydrolase fold-3 domain-containing protein n=1 Tax=Aromia moschata TaxID=1265417 RepID=A0AAV8XF23_9CUCU|nr:hypothetical protein NQ318_011950 [Aromia moschata]